MQELLIGIVNVRPNLHSKVSGTLSANGLRGGAGAKRLQHPFGAGLPHLGGRHDFLTDMAGANQPTMPAQVHAARLAAR